MNSVITMFLAGGLWLLNGMNFVVGLGSLMWLLIAASILIVKISKQEDR
jgi:predicted metal-binding membrane protein